MKILLIISSLVPFSFHNKIYELSSRTKSLTFHSPDPRSLLGLLIRLHTLKLFSVLTSTFIRKKKFDEFDVLILKFASGKGYGDNLLFRGSSFTGDGSSDNPSWLIYWCNKVCTPIVFANLTDISIPVLTKSKKGDQIRIHDRRTSKLTLVHRSSNPTSSVLFSVTALCQLIAGIE